MTAPLTILFAGGGTGGHLFPGIAVANELVRIDPSTRVVFVGSSRAIESKIVAESGLEHRILPVEPLTTLKQNPIRFVLQNWRGIRTAKQLLNEYQPAAVIGLGGFASAPLVWAARRSHIPIILLEQNVIPGRTTKWLSRLSSVVCVSFEQTTSRLPHAPRLIVTGNPVRTEIADLHSAKKSQLENPIQTNSTSRLLILGGSQGADSLNDAVLSAITQTKDLFRDWEIVHQTGPREAESIRTSYERLGLTGVVEPFFSEMANEYSRATLVISRAGATTLAELACVGAAMILVPYPHAADDHQRANAQHFVDNHAAIMVEHSGSSEFRNNLVKTLARLVNQPEERRKLGESAFQLANPDAAGQVARVVVETVEGRSKSK